MTTKILALTDAPPSLQGVSIGMAIGTVRHPPLGDNAGGDGNAALRLLLYRPHVVKRCGHVARYGSELLGDQSGVEAWQRSHAHTLETGYPN